LFGFIEFAYNRSVHFTIDSPFQIVYDFNLLTPLDFILLSIDEKVSLYGNRKAQMVKTLYKSVQQQIEKKLNNMLLKLNKVLNVLFF
jgi:hypothetical protein